MSERERLIRNFKLVADWLYGGGKGDDDIRCHSVSAVVTRFSQKCCSPYHKKPKTYPPRTLMIVERALFDDQWRSAYTCNQCVEQSLAEPILMGSAAHLHKGER